MAAPAETIAAIATAPGRGGIGVVRISGRQAPRIAQAVLGKCPAPRHAAYLEFLEADGTVIDRGIAIYFPAPHSYTGEDVLELQGHGGTAVMQRLLQRCLQLGARLAEPGEFTRRAYLNDKLDLAQAEAVADLIEASTAQAAQSAMRSLRGEFSQHIHALRDQLVNLRLYVEACLDFPEEDIDFITQGGVAEKLAGVAGELEHVLASARQGNLLREGIHVVLIGQPNVGKSSLMNQLAGEEVAIVTAVAGTTRDTIRSAIQIDGVPLHVIDTAGLRDTRDEIEQQGIARTWKAAENAQVALLLIDVAHGITQAEKTILERLASVPYRVWIHNKIDLTQAPPRIIEQDGETHIHLSAKTGDGIELLRAHLLQLAGWQSGGEGVFMARERHLRALAQVRECLQRASANLQQPELLAEELRLAQEALNEITGEFTSDDLLGEIFSRFCIGK
ncbi:MAG: tRNA uridine-5-carboxymethylaminomethyl(34) synthesis GTPase MnmE [Methylophilales bacterium RIFCSPHIGHO2_02_FULL_57_10]|nr:MAG: tRNA uridine-5-carboxymethylaminomethyl(34) synthesis GTPase MnmE [Methylophilales bacterium RIFCSPHIGHO2_02_FULL_57_10]